MKKIYFILATLVILISGMSYMYFSTLNKAGVQADLSLELVSKNAGFIFSFQNDKSVRNILSGQALLNNLVGEEKVVALQGLQAALQHKEMAPLFEGQDVYLGIYPSEQKRLDFMVAVQLSPEANEKLLNESLKRSGLALKPYATYQQVQLSANQTYYVLIQQRVVLIASASSVIDKLIASPKDNSEADFISFIQKSDRLGKNSLANLYINFKQLGSLMRSITPYFNRAELALLNKQHAYARLTYNFSKEKVFFSGETKVLNSDSYFSLFANLKPEKIELDKVLPANTASYTLFAFGDYKTFHTGLQKWFATKKEDKNVQGKIKAINEKYRLNLDEVFLRYTSSQAITVQLQNKQKLAAIKLNSGEKVEQLLLDLSEDYDGEIRELTEPDLLYYYFGEPFKSFKKPYYLIINNYIIFAAYPSSLLDFRNSYQNNNLLVLDKTYGQVYKQLPLSANILFYLNNRKAQNIIINTIYPEYYNQFRSENGLKAFDSFVYQLSGDQGTFQSNVLFSLPPATTATLRVEADSLLVR
ncbi:hypothetical protein ACTHQF_12110 [Pedobacter sp. SAFR-022]|uniref:hypothetical protein n=1 Tax=Pedobacter sp. SAFR-022 TaxID=3436861 RepID=UPI003F80B90F